MLFDFSYKIFLKVKIKMKKYYINKYTYLVILAVIFGALSQPIIAYGFIKIETIINNISTISLFDLWLILLNFLIAIGFASLSHFIKDYISNYEMNQLRKDVFYSILNKTQEEFHQKDSSEYYNYVLKKIDIWQTGYYDQLWNILQFVVELSCIYYIIFSTNIIAGFVSVIILIPLIINNLIFPNIIQKANDEFLNEDSRMVSKLKELLAGFDCIKNFWGEQFFSKKMNCFFDSANFYNQSVSKLNNISGTIANACVMFSQVSGICIGLLLMKEEAIGMGQFIVLVQLLSYVNEPVIKLINSTVAFASVKNIKNELNDIILQSKEKDKVQVEKIKTLRLENIAYKYKEKQEYVIKNFNFVFEVNKKYLIIGKSGSGKSTLIKIILRALEQNEGNVYFNDVVLNENGGNQYIGVVPQNIYIFNDTIRNNVDLLHRYSNTEVESAIQKAELSKFVESKKDKIDSQINEEVIQVSGGERSRIGLARVFLENKPIMIFDEILSNLDEKNAYNIEKNILEIKGKIVIHVAHKYSRTLMHLYDEIIDLSNI